MRTALLAIVMSVALSPAAALAHEDTGRFEDVRIEVIDPLTLSIKARLIYPNDGEPADGATVTAVAEQLGAPASAPSPLQELAPGEYSAELTVPTGGSWTIRLTALTPSATTETIVEVPEPATTTTATRSTTTETSPTATSSLADDSGDDGDGDLIPKWAAVAIGATIALGVAGWQTARSRRRR